jgi:hypothetical protein
MSVDIEVVQAATGEVVKAFGRLLPQLSSSARRRGGRAPGRP